MTEGAREKYKYLSIYLYAPWSVETISRLVDSNIRRKIMFESKTNGEKQQRRNIILQVDT